MDNRMTEKTGQDSPKVVVLRNGSPVLVSADVIGKGSPSGQRQIMSHYDDRHGQRSPGRHEPESKRPYQVVYNRGEWDGDIRHIIQSDHKENFSYLSERKAMMYSGADSEHVRIQAA